MDIIKWYICCLVASCSDKMSDDRAWMYTGRPNQKEITNEWAMKTKEFLRAVFANGQRKTWCPCVRCDNYKQATEVDMGKHLQKWGYKPVIRCGASMASLPDDGERRWSVSARMSTEPGL